MPLTRRHALAAAVCAAAASAIGSAWADAYPAKPITLVVAYPAGGDTDALARLFAEKLATRVGQPVLVDNRPGASGIIGSAFVSKAAPDGYTLLLAPSTFSIAQLVLKTGGTSGYDVLAGFTPIVQTGSQPLFLVAGAGSGFASLKDAVAAAMEEPGINWYLGFGWGALAQVRNEENDECAIVIKDSENRYTMEFYYPGAEQELEEMC